MNIEKKDWRNQRPFEDENNTTSVIDENAVLLFVDEEECHVADPCTCWIVYWLKTSYNVTSKKEFFTLYKEGNIGKVKMRNSRDTSIDGNSKDTNNGRTLTLKGERHVLDLHLNLTFVYTLDFLDFKQTLGMKNGS